MIEILLVDDHNIVIDGITSYLKDDKNIIIKDIARDGEIAYKKFFNSSYDILITDLNMPKVTGIELIRKIKLNFPKTKIITLTTYYNGNILKELKKLNVEGIVIKNLGISELKKAILKVSSGTKYYSEIPDLYKIKNKEEWDDFSKLHNLSPREIDILILICDGKSSNEIASILFISEQTVSSHRKNIMKKTQSHSVIDLFKLAIKYGLH